MSVSASVRRLTAAAGVAAAVVGTAALPASAADHHSDRAHYRTVVISDVQHDSRGRYDRSDRSMNREWVDITNNGRRAVNLDRWTLSDRDGHTYTFRHVRLDGRQTVRVHTGYGRDTRYDLFWDRRASVWDADRDTATLRNDHGRFIDDVSWGGHRH
ncbi:lamin tail domain-containing protein [Streptomyces sp. NPDC048297]|uniref:lamin tail domain-containing protein n=1 Tax=Streptomyces sp. NPDC048297 TaxID=3365531 RepID=UPI0037174CFF